MSSSHRGRRLPIGAELQTDGQGAHFRVWAPKPGAVEVVLDTGDQFPLKAEGNGYFSALVPGVRAGQRYRFRLGDGDQLYPDPASRFQPEGPHGPSEVIDPSFAWSARGWRGRTLEDQVLYELHFGTFTPAGTFAAATEMLSHLTDLGITLIEIMPIAEFAGAHGWGYDGVDLFAPAHVYGRPDDLRAFVDRAHHLGIGVILDVVYNHFGPDGNYLSCYSDAYFTDRYKNDWGASLNFDGEDAGPVRELFIANARYWIEEFHFDGLRLDATQDIKDHSDSHVIRELTAAARAAAPDRSIVIIAENEPQSARLLRPQEAGGYGLDGVWNDDFHHTAMVALTGRAEAYYSDYRGTPQELISASKWGYLYQGQWYRWQKQPRGSAALDIEPHRFITYLQNHDQVANSAGGLRMNALASPADVRAMTALLLLGPGTPLLFQGQEFGASTPFLYFADHKKELIEPVYQGRKEFLRQFKSLATEEVQEQIDPPSDRDTFLRSKLDHSERATHAPIYRLHRDLLRMRRDDRAFRQNERLGVHGAVLATHVFLLRFIGPDQDDRLLLINLGADHYLDPAPEPLLAPPEDARWTLRWSSESVSYGGTGTPPLDPKDNLYLPAHSALVLAPEVK